MKALSIDCQAGVLAHPNDRILDNQASMSGLRMLAAIAGVRSTERWAFIDVGALR